MRNKKIIYFIVISALLFSFGFSLPASGLTEQRSDLKEKNLTIKPPERFRESVRIWLEDYSFSPGEELKINFEVKKRSYVYIYNVGPRGKVKLLFPNKFDKDNYLSAGSYVLPKKNYQISAGDTVGTEHLQIVAASQRLNYFDERKDFSRHSFTPLGSEPAVLKEDLETKLVGREMFWSSDWLSFRVAEESGRIRVTSSPEGGRVYVDGQYLGRTPLTAELTAAEKEVYIELQGVGRWRKTVEVEPDRTIRVRGNLRTGEPRREEPEGSAEATAEVAIPVSSLGFLGSPDSISAEVIFAEKFGLGTGIRWPDNKPEKTIDGYPYSFAGEYEIYGIYQESFVSDIIDLWIFGGVSVREFRSEPVGSSSGTLSLRPLIEVDPDYETSLSPLGGVGLSFSRKYFDFRAGWGSKRGLLFGVHFRI